jgi:hypothetical protein
MKYEIEDSDIPNCLRVQESNSDFNLFMRLWDISDRKEQLTPYYHVYMDAYNTYMIWQSVAIFNKNSSHCFATKTKTEILQPFIKLINTIDRTAYPIFFEEALMFEILLGIHSATDFLNDPVRNKENNDQCCIIFDSGLLVVRRREYVNDPEIIELAQYIDELSKPMMRQYNILMNKPYNSDSKEENVEFSNLIKKILSLDEYFRKRVDELEISFHAKKTFEPCLEKIPEDRQNELCNFLAFYTEVFTKYDEWKQDNDNNRTVEDILQPFLEKSHSIAVLTPDEILMFNTLFADNCRHWHPVDGFPGINDLMANDHSYFNKIDEKNNDTINILLPEEQNDDDNCDDNYDNDDNFDDDNDNNNDNNNNNDDDNDDDADNDADNDDDDYIEMFDFQSNEQRSVGHQESDIVTNRRISTPSRQPNNFNSICEDWQLYGICLRDDCEYYHTNIIINRNSNV